MRTIIKLLKEKEEINVVNDQFGSPTCAGDLAEAIMQIIVKLPGLHSLRPIPGIYNYSNKGIISWYDFAIEIKRLIGSNYKINPILASHYPTVAKRPAYSALDTIKIQEVFGITPKDWAESLACCLAKM